MENNYKKLFDNHSNYSTNLLRSTMYKLIN